MTWVILHIHVTQGFAITLGTCSKDFFDYRDILSFNNQNVIWGEIINKVICIHWNKSRKYKNILAYSIVSRKWINTDCWNLPLVSGHTLTCVACYCRHYIVAGMHRYIRPTFPASNNLAFILHLFHVCTSTCTLWWTDVFYWYVHHLQKTKIDRMI